MTMSFNMSNIIFGIAGSNSMDFEHSMPTKYYCIGISQKRIISNIYRERIWFTRKNAPGRLFYNYYTSSIEREESCDILLLEYVVDPTIIISFSSGYLLLSTRTNFLVN